MNEKIFADLFEDEVAEVLRDFPTAKITDAHHEFYPACMICEDGVYSSGSGMYSVYIDGTRAGQVNKQYLLSYLAHATFAVVER